MARLLLFVHYNKHNDVSDYIFYLLEKIRPIFEKEKLNWNIFICCE